MYEDGEDAEEDTALRAHGQYGGVRCTVVVVGDGVRKSWCFVSRVALLQHGNLDGSQHGVVKRCGYAERLMLVGGSGWLVSFLFLFPSCSSPASFPSFSRGQPCPFFYETVLMYVARGCDVHVSHGS